MGLLRAIAWVCLLVAVILLTNDVTRAATHSGPWLKASLTLWRETSPQTLQTAATYVQRSLHPKLWDPVVVHLLSLPAWSLLGAFGVMFALLGRRKRRINIYAN